MERQHAYNSLKDETLWDFARHGDAKALSVLYRRHYDLMFNFGLKYVRDEDVVAEPVVVLDGPDSAAAHHADIEYLHDHEQVAPETRQLGTYDEVAAADFAEEFSQTPDRPVLGAADGLFYPAVDGDALPVAELENFKSLILNCLLVTAHSDVSEIHNAHSTIIRAVRIIRAASPALCRMHRQAQLFQN